MLRGPAWDLTVVDDARPLYTFPKVTWDRQLLPAAQIVPCPTATFRGNVNGTQIGEGRGALAAFIEVERGGAHNRCHRQDRGSQKPQQRLCK